VTTKAQAARLWRSWEQYHLSKGWRGIAYNYAVGAGALWRLRGTKHRNGAHWGDSNTTGRAIVFPINAQEVPDPRDLLMFARVWLEDPMPVKGHQEVQTQPTSCPGADLLAWIHTDGWISALGVWRWRDRSPVVRSLRYRLRQLGYGTGRLRWARYTKRTRRAIIAFQEDHGLVADGICGPATFIQLGATT